MDFVSSLRRQAGHFLPKAKAALTGLVATSSAVKMDPALEVAPVSAREAFSPTCPLELLDDAMRPLRTDDPPTAPSTRVKDRGRAEADVDADAVSPDSDDTSFPPTRPDPVRASRLVRPAESGDLPHLFGSHENLSAEALAVRQDLQYQPDALLLSSLITALQTSAKWSKPVVVNTFQGLVLVDAPYNLACVNMDNAQWAALMTRPLVKRPTVQVVADVDQVAFEARPIRQTRLDQLLWRAGLDTAIGRFPAGTDLNKAVHLKHWPNLTRLESIPHGLRIAALWTARGAGLLETSEILKIPQRHVFAFYSAALALDLVVEKKTFARRPRPSATSQAAGLFKRLVESMA